MNFVVGFIVAVAANAFRVVKSINGQVITLNHVEWTTSGPFAVTTYEIQMTEEEIERLVLKGVLLGASSVAGSGVDTFFDTVTVAIAKPVNTVLPAVTGTPTVGQTLTTTNGTWTGSPTLTRQWQVSLNGTSGWTNISGQTALTHVLAAPAGRYIRCLVQGVTASGTVQKASNVVGPIA